MNVRSAKLVKCVSDGLPAAKKKRRNEDWLQRNESSILQQEIENENLKHQIERLENELKLKEGRFKDVLYLCKHTLEQDDSLFRDYNRIFEEMMSYIEKMNFQLLDLKHEIERLKNELELKEDRFKELMYLFKQALEQDDSLIRDYSHIFSEMMNYIEKMNFQLSESQVELKKKEDRIKDLEIKIQENVDKSKNFYVAPTAEKNRLCDSLLETSAQDLFSSFHMVNVYNHLVPQTVQRNSPSLMHSKPPMENVPFESPKNYVNFDRSTPNQDIHHDDFMEPKTPDSISRTIAGSNMEICITPIQFRQDLKSSRLEEDDEDEISIDNKSQNETVIFVKSMNSDERQKFICNGCSRVFYKKKRLRAHLQDCGTRMQSSDDNGKIKGSRSKNTFECKVCHNMYKWKCNLNRHLRYHNGERPFKCKICGKSFTESSTLNKHQRVHDGKRPFTCEVCGKSFNQNGNLITHQRIHDGKRPFTCEVCGKSFNQNGNLITHQRVHDGKRPFICATCGKTFAGKSDLKKHIMGVHMKSMKCFKCKICRKSFSKRNSLNERAVSHKTRKTLCSNSSAKKRI